MKAGLEMRGNASHLRRRCTPLLAAAALIGALLVISSAQSAARLDAASTLSSSADAINTTGYEDSPYLSPDGRSFYFMYSPWSTWPALFGDPAVRQGPLRPGHHNNPDSNAWEDADIYVATKQDDGRWGAPVNLGFNDAQADCCAMTWDGKLFAYQRTQWANSALTDLAFMERQPDNTWRRTILPNTVNASNASESNPHLTASGNAIYFTSDRSGGLGGTDLYVTRRASDGSWQAPQNMGPQFNTAEDEDQLWMSRDGRTIYFNREPGPTIMVSQLINGGWTAPAVVRFGGSLVPGAEVSVTDDGYTMVFARVRFDLSDIEMVSAARLPNGEWGEPQPIELRAPSAPRGVRIIASP